MFQYYLVQDGSQLPGGDSHEVTGHTDRPVKICMDVGKNGTNFQLVFEVVKGRSINPDLYLNVDIAGIDNIELSSGICSGLF